MRTKPKVLILRTEGTNCDEELFYAFQLAGGNPEYVHVNELRNKTKKMNDYKILALPGGFAYGDDIVSGKILAVELTSFFSEELKKFIDRKDTLVIGICNGFQVLVRTGLLPFRNVGKMDAILTNNDSGHFECRWINVKVETNSKCVFLNKGFLSRHSDNPPDDGASRIDSGQSQNVILASYQVAHGEGKFFADEETLKKIEHANLVAFRYVNGTDKPTQEYPYNPNGALNAIAGITDTTGRILGLMPHPERFVLREQYPNWRREEIVKSFHQNQNKPHGLPIFENAIKFCRII